MAAKQEVLSAHLDFLVTAITRIRRAAIRRTAAYRTRQGHPFTGLQPSIGTVGDELDNALAETAIGLYRTERIRDCSPFRKGPLVSLTEFE